MSQEVKTLMPLSGLLYGYPRSIQMTVLDDVKVRLYQLFKLKISTKARLDLIAARQRVR